MSQTVQLPPDEPERLREIITRLGLPGIVDVHTHFMPQRMLDKVWGYFDRIALPGGAPWPIAYRLTQEERLARLRDLGVRRFTSLTYPHKPGMAQWLNTWTARFAEEHEDCLRSATFYPEEGAGTYVAEAVEAGTRVFKAHVQVGDYDPHDPLLDEVWGVLQESAVPVVIHAGHGPERGRFTGPEAMSRLLDRFPRLVLVFAHLGMPDYGAFLDLAERFDGVHLDTTMAFTPFTEALHPFPREELPRLDALGDKILWGSDFPNIPYAYLEAVEALLGLGLGDAWARGVLHDNAARLLRVPAAAS